MPKRIQRKRTKGWRMPEGTVYVGRPTRWGNPFVVGGEYVRRKMQPGGGQSANTVVDNEHAVRLFRRFTARETLYQIEAHRQLHGKDLACFCPLDQPCHADVLLELANARLEPTKGSPMTDTVTEAAIEIGARATYTQHEHDLHDRVTVPWPDLPEETRAVYRHSARAALEAALPLIVAGERERCAQIVENQLTYTEDAALCIKRTKL